VIGAVLIIEAAGLGGAILPVVLLPGLVAAGIGSLVFIGLGSWSGFSTTAWELSPFPLETYGGPGLGDFAWTIVLAIVAAIGTFGVMEVARLSERLVRTRRFTLTVAGGVAVGLLAITFAEVTDEPADTVLFSGQEAFGALFESSDAAVSTLILLLVLKAAAWSISLGSFRGGPTFPAIFLGAVGGIIAADLPGYSETPAVAGLVGATCVSVLRLPLSSVLIALLLGASAGLAVAPLVIVAVVVAYLVSLALTAYVDTRIGRDEQANGLVVPADDDPTLQAGER
jgi:hypothetical protein